MSLFEPEGLSGLFKVLVQSARRDKELMKKDLSVPLGRDFASFVPHINAENDPRVAMLHAVIHSETLLLSLKGAKVRLAIPPEARSIMADLALTRKEFSLQIPARERTLYIETLGRKAEGGEQP